MRIRLLGLCIAFFGLMANAALADYMPPKLVGRVSDYGHFLTSDQRAALSDELKELEGLTKTRVQVAVLTLNSLGGNAVEDVAKRTHRAWGLGDKKYDNSVLIVLAKVGTGYAGRIEVGSGLKPVLADADARLLLRSKVMPLWERKFFYAGFEASLEKLRPLLLSARDQPVARAATLAVEKEEDSPFLAGLILLIVAVVVIGIVGYISGPGPESEELEEEDYVPLRDDEQFVVPQHGPMHISGSLDTLEQEEEDTGAVADEDLENAGGEDEDELGPRGEVCDWGRP